ncbi:MAG: hypothetical protein AB1774_01115 [Bacillota bacterium]
MDAIFGLFFLLYLAVSVIAAVSKVFRAKPRGAGAPWPEVPPLRAPVSPDDAREAPVTTEWLTEEGRSAESVQDAAPGADEAAGGTPIDEDNWPSTEGETMEGESLQWDNLQDQEEEGAELSPPDEAGGTARIECLPEMAIAGGMVGEFTRPELVRAIIMSEVLGPPRVFRPCRMRP